jgi:hypothetical protein
MELHPSNQSDTIRLPDVIDETAEYEVEEVLDKRCKGRRVEYLVKWVGYPPLEVTWEPRGALMKHANDVVLEYEKGTKVRAQPRTIEDASHSGRGACHSADPDVPRPVPIPALSDDNALYEP